MPAGTFSASPNVHAPFDGIVYFAAGKTRGFRHSGDLMPALDDLRKVQVRAFVDEPDVGKLSPGMQSKLHGTRSLAECGRRPSIAIPSTVKLHGSRNVGETHQHRR